MRRAGRRKAAVKPPKRWIYLVVKQLNKQKSGLLFELLTYGAAGGDEQT